MMNPIQEKTGVFGKGRKAAGFSLIEVLVSIVLLGISLLGLAMLQAQGTSLGTDAYSRTQASLLAYDIMDRIRSNADNLSDYGGTAASTCDELDGSAANDLACWDGAIDSALGPDSDGVLVVDITVPSVDVTVNWTERELRDDGDTQYEVDRSSTWSMEL